MTKKTVNPNSQQQNNHHHDIVKTKKKKYASPTLTKLGVMRNTENQATGNSGVDGTDNYVS